MVFISILFYLLVGPMVLADDSGLEVCFTDALARRSGQSNCWVKYERIVNSERVYFCIPRKLWRDWLAHVKPSSCFKLQGKWKTRSYPVLNGEKPKERVRTFFASSMNPKPHQTVGVGMVRSIEVLRERVSVILESHDSYGWIRKLVLNETVPGVRHDILRILGFVHLITPAGIHLYGLARVSYQGSAILFIRGGLSLKWALTLARSLSLLFWLFGWLLGGGRPGMMRPGLVVAMRSVFRFLGLKWGLYWPLAISLSLDCSVALYYHWSYGFDPSPGRMHYALAVGGGLMAMDYYSSHAKRPHFLDGIRDHCALSVGSWLPVAILDSFEMGWIAFGTPLISLLTIPLFSYAVYPSLVVYAALLSINIYIDIVCGLVVQTSSYFVNFIAEWSVRLPNLWIVAKESLIVSVLFATLLTTFCEKKHRWSVLILLSVCGVGLRWVGVESKNVVWSGSASTIELLDVGQGDSILVRPTESRERAGLLDVGSFWALTSDAWLKVLFKRGISKIDWIVLSHLDEDHAGALIHLLKVVDVDCVVTAQSNWTDPERREWLQEVSSFPFKKRSWGQKCFPYVGKRIGTKQRGSNHSMSGVVIPFESGVFVSLGDADSKEEEASIRWIQNSTRLFPNKKRFILKVSHHGSRFSTSEFFLNILKPDEAWISSGIGNRYGHPTFEVLSNLSQKGIRILRTDQLGTISTEQTSAIGN